MKTRAVIVKKELNKLANAKRAKVSAWFFKTKLGQYGHGDKFIGISVPNIRKVAHKYLSLDFDEIGRLIKSPIHEFRFAALEILVGKYERALESEKKKIVDFYLKNRKFINNWDLVDTSVEYILGDYLFDKDKSILYKFAKSKNLWERRMAVVATFAFIKKNKFTETLKISKLLLNDQQDLIHKAVGWMLREVGKRSLKTEVQFLDKHNRLMPRTALRYAIERLPENKRKYYLHPKVKF